MVERIRELLQARQLSPTQFADAIGVARPIISHILGGRNKPSLEVVQKILAAFPDVAMPWLLTGQGPMLTGTPGPAAAAPPPAEPPLAASAAPTPPRRLARPAPEPNVAQKERKPAPLAAATPDAAEPASMEQPVMVAAPSAAQGPAVAAPAAPAPTAGAPVLPVATGGAKTIRRVLIFYSDGTFTDFSPAPEGL